MVAVERSSSKLQDVACQRGLTGVAREVRGALEGLTEARARGFEGRELGC